MDAKSMFESMVVMIQKDIPGFRIAYKDESIFMKQLGSVISMFCPTFMTNFTTTIGTTVYFPSYESVARDYKAAWKTLAHEYVHAWDYARNPVCFALRYIMPQALTVAVLLATFAWVNLWWLVALLALVAIGPWPSRGRTEIELRGYSMTIAVDVWTGGDVSPSTVNWITKVFIGWDYYRMASDANEIHERLTKAVDRLKSGAFLEGKLAAPYRKVHDLITA
jgi:hypothetical protein